MKPVTVTLSAVATSAVIPLDIYNDPFNVALGLKVTGTNTSTVEYTFDDIFDPTVTPAWTAHASLSAKTTSADSNLAFPARAVRLNMTAFTAGSATLIVIQSGIGAAA